MNTRKKLGFTLVEILIVIVIIGILGAAILPKLLGTKDKANDVARIADIHNISLALQSYMQDNGQYPGGCSSLNNTLAKNKEFMNIISTLSKDPQKNNGLGGVTAGEYYYCALKKNNIPKASFALAAKMSSHAKANLIASNPGWEYKTRTWESVKSGLESCPDGIKEGTNDNKCQAMPKDGYYRYIVLGP